MKKSALRARISVLESDLERISADRHRSRANLARAEAQLREIGQVLSTITDRAIALDARSVGGWFAMVTITTPTLIMLAEGAKKVLEQNREALRVSNRATTGGQA